MDYSNNEQGKCIGCGFLAKHAQGRHQLPTPRFFEIDLVEREIPNLYFIHQVPPSRGLLCNPVCFVGKTDIMAEVGEVHSDPEKFVNLLVVVKKDRHCDRWYEHVPGLNPMEHLGLMRDERLEAARREYEARTEESRRRYEAAMAGTAEADRRLFEKSQRRQDRALVVAGLILGAAQIIAAAILSYRESFTDQIMRRLFGH